MIERSDGAQPPVRTVRRYGRGGLLVEVDGPDEVHPFCRAVEMAGLATEIVPGWSSVLVIPAGDPADIGQRLRNLPVRLGESVETQPPAPDPVEIEVIYDGPDLIDVAALVGADVDDVVAWHTEPTYTVVMLGFSRGFPYLAGTHPALADVPRLDTPRTRVPAGSVALAASQTGIYPADSPGGWRLLGRTTATLFDPLAWPPTPLRPGGRVRLRAVERPAFAERS